MRYANQLIFISNIINNLNKQRKQMNSKCSLITDCENEMYLLIYQQTWRISRIRPEFYLICNDLVGIKEIPVAKWAKCVLVICPLLVSLPNVLPMQKIRRSCSCSSISIAQMFFSTLFRLSTTTVSISPTFYEQLFLTKVLIHLLFAYSFALWFFCKRKLLQKLFVNCWWNWLRKQSYRRNLILK